MLRSLFLILLLFMTDVSGFASNVAIVRTAINPDTGNTYYLLRSSPDNQSGLTWTEAEQASVALGGHLVSIGSQEEYDWILSSFPASGLDYYVWIGLSDAESEGDFAWSDGSPLNFDFWASGEPNDYQDGEDYVLFYNFNNFRWNDTKDIAKVGTYPKSAIVEVPAPASIPFFGPWPVALLTTSTDVLLGFLGYPEASIRLESSEDLNLWNAEGLIRVYGIAGVMVLPMGDRTKCFYRAHCIIPLHPGIQFDYVASGHAFYPDLWLESNESPLMRAYEGNEIVFLAGDQWCSEPLDPITMSSFVGQLDAGWKVYRDRIGKSPATLKTYSGLPTIAAVPNTDLLAEPYGRGYLGSTGIEVAGFYSMDYAEHHSDPLSFRHYYFYGMGRNYYLYGDRHSLFTTGFAVFMRYVCMDALNLRDYNLADRLTIEGREADYAASGIDWFEAFVGAGLGLPKSDPTFMYASIMLTLRKEYGESWVRDFYHQLFTCPTADKSTTEGQVAQALNFVVTASLAAGEDLTPRFCGRWKFPLDAVTSNRLSQINWADERAQKRSAGEVISDL